MTVIGWIMAYVHPLIIIYYKTILNDVSSFTLLRYAPKHYCLQPQSVVSNEQFYA